MPKLRRTRRAAGHIYRRGTIWWLKWTSADHRRHHRSSESTDRRAAERLLHEELRRKAEGLNATPDPRHCRVDELLKGISRGTVSRAGKASTA